MHCSHVWRSHRASGIHNASAVRRTNPSKRLRVVAESSSSAAHPGSQVVCLGEALFGESVSSTQHCATADASHITGRGIRQTCARTGLAFGLHLHGCFAHNRPLKQVCPPVQPVADKWPSLQTD